VISDGAGEQLKDLLKIVDQRFSPLLGDLRRLLDKESKKIDDIAKQLTMEARHSLPPSSEPGGGSELPH
jgi:hypothetical protein